jgi:long-chain acyl-CoA synthetase
MSGRPDVAGAVSYEQMLSRSGAIADSVHHGDDIALLLSTGGTTGRAKQAALSHGNVLLASLAQLAAESGTGEVFVHVAPLFHLAGTQIEFRDALPLSTAGKVLKTQLRAESSPSGCEMRWVGCGGPGQR